MRRTLRTALAAAAVLIIVAAIGVGGLRLAMMRLPSYQAQIEQWASESLGIGLGFERLDARLGLRGPELTFHGASVRAPSEREPFLVARRAAVVLDAWALVTSRELRAKRLTFDGTEFTLLRRGDGRLQLERAPPDGAAADLALLLPPELEVAMRDGSVVYIDEARGVHWPFHDVALDLGRTGGTLELQARARPPGPLGSRFEVGVQGDFRRDGGWRVYADVRGTDLAELAAALPGLPYRPERGSGDAAVWLEWRDAGFVRGMIDASLADVALGDAAGTSYDRVAMSAEWMRADAGWRIVLNDVDVARNGREWVQDADTVIDLAFDGDGLEGVSVQSTFVRLDDLAPLVALLPDSAPVRRWSELDPRGDIADLDFHWRAERQDFALSARFDGLAASPGGGRPGFDGLSGELRADPTSGRLSLDSTAASLIWPQVFRTTIALDELSGLLVWREGADALTIVTDDLLAANADARARANLELTLPHDGNGARLDLVAGVDELDAVAAKRYLPVHRMPRRVAEWLDGAIRGGTVRDVELAFVGPLAAFPFDDGEGTFRVTAGIEDGVLAYVGDWPRAENLDGEVELVNASLSARGSGRVLRNVGEDVRVTIEDLRRPVLAIDSRTRGPLGDVLAFLRSAPPIARQLGPGYDRIDLPDGTGSVTLSLELPLGRMAEYGLDASLDIENGTLAIAGLEPIASEIRGTLHFKDGVVTGDDLDAIFLDGPVAARVTPAGREGYRSRIELDGEVTAAATVDAFDLPLENLVAGQARWRADVLLPSAAAELAAGATTVADAAPLLVSVTSNLSGLALQLPEPFSKQASEPTSLQLDLAFGAAGLDVSGHVGATRRFVLAFSPGDDGYDLERAALALGGALPELKASGGLGVYGSVAKVDFDAWAALARRPASGAARGQLAASGLGELFVEADLDIGDFTAFGQQLGAAALRVRRGDTDWRIGVDSGPVAGTITVPRDLVGRPSIVADLERLYVLPSRRSGATVPADPRRLLGVQLTAAEFGFGTRRFGTLKADVRADPLGLRMSSFESSGPSFTVSGSGGWFEGPGGQTTRLAFNLQSTDVAGALTALSLDPIAAGEMADITGSVYWPGAPTDDWMQHLGGDLSLRLEKGSLLDIDPGAGRVVGLMSITALPRRLALDFRDVFNRGLVFDELAGDFALIDGNAYTDNLKVAGPAVEIGVAGRIGLRDRDYRQQAVVTAEPGNMLPTVGGLLGGPGVGAALLIFTRIFKEPLKGIGRASYCVTGSWDDPVVERLSAEQLEQGRLCADLPGGG